MHRWDIINHFIKKYDYKSYLEIGYFKGWSFDNVHCNFKIAVDPNPSKTPEQEQVPYGHAIIEAPHGIFKMTSDDFFTHPIQRDDFRDHKWDIVFIDGLHEASQVTKDISNSLLHLKENGIIILHDCNPPTLAHVTTGDAGGNWNGDVYKAVLEFRDNYEEQYSFYCIDTDWGVGVIRKREQEMSFMNPHTVGILWGRIYETEWDAFDQNREALLSLIPVEEFLKREAALAAAL